MFFQPIRRTIDGKFDTKYVGLKTASLLLFLGICLVHLAFLKPLVWGNDGNEILQVARSLVLNQSFNVPPEIGSNFGSKIGVGGQTFSIRYPLLPIIISPLVAVGIGLSHWLNLPELPVISTCALISSVVFTAATTSLVFLLAIRLGGPRSGAYIAALCFAFGTVALAYAQTLFTEPLLAFLTIASIYFAFGQSQTSWVGAIVLSCLAILAKPPGIVIGPMLSIYWATKRRPVPIVLGPLLALALGTIIYLAYNYLRFGNPFITGQPLYGGLTLVGMPQRFWGLLLSPGMGGGLLWYCPPVALSVLGFYKAMRAKPLEALALGGVCLGYLLLYSFWVCCGWDWGPRFLVPALPLLMSLTSLIDYRARRGLIVLAAFGFLINAPTLLSFYTRYYWELLALGQDYPNISLWGSLADAPIFHAWGAAFRQIGEALGSNAADLLAANEAETPIAMQIVPVWWWALPSLGLPLWLGGLFAVLLIVMGIVTLYRGWRCIADSNT